MKNKSKLLITVILMIITLSSITFAAFFVSKNQTNDNKVLSGCFDTTFTENSASIKMDKALPLTNEQGLNTNPYSFTISNTCSINADYTVLINIKENSFSENYISYNYSGNEVNTLNTAQVNNNVPSGFAKSYILGSGTLKRGKSETINIKLWLNELANYQDMTNKTFEAEIQVISRVSTNQQYGDLTLAYTFNSEDTDLSYTELYNEYEIDSISCSDGSAKLVTSTDGETAIVVTNAPAVCTINFSDIKQIINYQMYYDGTLGDIEANQMKSITGGYSPHTHGTTATNMPEQYTNYLKIYPVNTYVGCYTNNTINFSGYSKLYFLHSSSQNSAAGFYATSNRNSHSSYSGSQILFVPNNSTSLNIKSYSIIDLVDDNLYVGMNSGAYAETRVYEIFATKQDNIADLASKINVTASSIDDLLNNYSTQILNNKNAVKYMIKSCTGDFMASAVINSTFMAAYQNSPYKSLIDANPHWHKFIDMSTL